MKNKDKKPVPATIYATGEKDEAKPAPKRKPPGILKGVGQPRVKITGPGATRGGVATAPGAALLLLLMTLSVFGAPGIIPQPGTQSSVFTNRLLINLAASETTNRLYYTNGAIRPAFGVTNGVHIYSNATATARWEWRSSFSTVVATNDSNRPTGTWRAAAVGATLYGYSRYEPRSPQTVGSSPASTSPNPAFIQVNEVGVITSPTGPITIPNGSLVISNETLPTITFREGASNPTRLNRIYSDGNINLDNGEDGPELVVHHDRVAVNGELSVTGLVSQAGAYVATTNWVVARAKEFGGDVIDVSFVSAPGGSYTLWPMSVPATNVTLTGGNYHSTPTTSGGQILYYPTNEQSGAGGPGFDRANTHAVSFVTDDLEFVAVVYGQQDNGLNIVVDGVNVARVNEVPEETSFLRVRFSSIKKRTIKLVHPLYFGGIYVHNTNTVWATAAPRKTLLIMTDSFGAMNLGYYSDLLIQTFTLHLQDSLPDWNVVGFGQGGTGYFESDTGGKTNFLGRLRDILSLQPAAVIFFAGYNDRDYVTNTSLTNIVFNVQTNLFWSLRRELPTIPVWAIGPNIPNGPLGADAHVINFISSLSNACRVSPNITHVDPVAGKWFTGVNVTPDSGNSVKYTGIDGIHPSGDGHDYIAARILEYIKPTLDLLTVLSRSNYVILAEREAVGDHAHQAAAAAAGWNTRWLNNLDNYGGFVTTNVGTGNTGSNSFTLAPGRYYIEATAPGYATDRQMLMLTNVTDGTITLNGRSELNPGASIVYAGMRGRFELTSRKTFLLRHYMQTAPANAFGIAVSQAGCPEIYSTIFIQRE